MRGDKYLPIGTVCSIVKSNKDVMIIGYFSIVYNGKVKMYDYKACEFPEGLLLENKQISFNHSDIKEIIHYGLSNEQYDNLNSILTVQENSKEGKQEKGPFFSNIVFDENGVVVYDEVIYDTKEGQNQKFKISDETNINSNSEPSNPFYTEYEDKKDDNLNADNWPIFKNIVFDENGVVISAEEYE